MIILYIDGSDRTGDLQDSSLTISNAIQRRGDSAGFLIFQNTKPSENEEVLIYKGDEIANISGTTVTLSGFYSTGVKMFYPGQKLHIGVGNADEEVVEVDTYDEDSLTIELVSAPIGTHVATDKIAELVFGGTISKVEEKNVGVLANVEYEVECTDYKKIFDKKLISDSWTDVGARYIINDFLNTTINYNVELDDLNYENTAAIQAVWTASNDGDAADIDSSDYLEGTSSAVFAWTAATSGATTADWVAVLGTPADISDLSGAASGSPTAGMLKILYKTSSGSTSFDSIELGSSAANYVQWDDVAIENDGEWHELTLKLLNVDAVTGTPDWTAVDHIKIIVDGTTTDGQILIDDIRVLADGSFTAKNVEDSPEFDDFRSPERPPSSVMQTIAKAWEYVWWIDNTRDIHFKPKEGTPAPFSLNNSSNNFSALKTWADTSQLGNRVTVRGGERISDNYTYQIFEGNEGQREWDVVNKFANLEIFIDNNSSNAPAEAGTTTTNIKITGHGLETGDWVTNRTVSNTRRQITKVDNDNFTVEAVTGQTTGDTISFFSVSKTGGIDTVDPTTVDYIYNSNAANIRATDSEATLVAGEFIQFKFNERVEINLRYSDPASVTALKSLGFGDGIFDLDPIVDRNIDSVGTALAVAQAKVKEFSNATIEGSFRTDWHGLQAGQIITIEDTVRGFSESVVIQKIRASQQGGQYSDYFVYNVGFGTTLFGWIEFMQKVLEIKDKVQINVDAVIVQYAEGIEVVESSDSNNAATDGGFKSAKEGETVEASESNTVYDKTSGSWQWETSVGQTLPTRWGLFDWG